MDHQGAHGPAGAVFLGLGLPEFDARGEGRVHYVPTTQATRLQGRLEATASRLEAINPAWKAIGPIKLQAQFDVTADGPVARLRQLDLKLAGEKPVLVHFPHRKPPRLILATVVYTWVVSHPAGVNLKPVNFTRWLLRLVPMSTGTDVARVRLPVERTGFSPFAVDHCR